MKSVKERFPDSVIEILGTSKILGIRAGSEHRFIGVWVVVVQGRVFIRSWDNKPDGWYQAFVMNSAGAIQIPNGREIGVRSKKARGERLLDAIDAAYAKKYHTPASQKYVRGFALPERRMTTLEITPA